MKRVAVIVAALVLIAGGYLILRNEDDYTRISVKYGQYDANVMDIYLPNSDNSFTATPFVYVHGGGWISGDKMDGREWADRICNKGYVFISINYRFIELRRESSITCEDILDDIQAAIGYLKEHADEYRITVSEIAIGGPSAGGHLALLYSYTRESPIPVKLVISMAGPTDFTDPSFFEEVENRPGTGGLLPGDAADIANTLAGSNYSLAELRDESLIKPEIGAISPIYHVTATAPYTILAHGDHDNVIPVSNSIRLEEKMNSVGLGELCCFVRFANSEHTLSNDPDSSNHFYSMVLEQMHRIGTSVFR